MTCDAYATGTALVALAEAAELVELTRAKGLIFAVPLNNTGDPMVRQAREMIEAGEIGDIRVVHAAYVQDWLTLPIDTDGHKQAEWLTDPGRADPAACLADIGTHAHSLQNSTSSSSISSVSAFAIWIHSFICGRSSMRLQYSAMSLSSFTS